MAPKSETPVEKAAREDAELHEANVRRQASHRRAEVDVVVATNGPGPIAIATVAGKVYMQEFELDREQLAELRRVLDSAFQAVA